MSPFFFYYLKRHSLLSREVKTPRARCWASTFYLLSHVDDTAKSRFWQASKLKTKQHAHLPRFGFQFGQCLCDAAPPESRKRSKKREN